MLSSCATTYKRTFPLLGEVERIETDTEIISINKDGEKVFIYDKKADTVTIPRWYWIKLINYGIDTDGIKM